MFFGTVSSYNPKTGWFLILYEDGDSEEVNLKELKKILYKIFKFKGGAEKSLLAQKNAKIKADKIAAQSLARIQRAGKFDSPIVVPISPGSMPSCQPSVWESLCQFDILTLKF